MPTWRMYFFLKFSTLKLADLARAAISALFNPNVSRGFGAAVAAPGALEPQSIAIPRVFFHQQVIPLCVVFEGQLTISSSPGPVSRWAISGIRP